MCEVVKSFFIVLLIQLLSTIGVFALVNHNLHIGLLLGAFYLLPMLVSSLGTAIYIRNKT